MKRDVASENDRHGDELEAAGKLVGYSSGRRYRVRGTFIFEGIPLRNARVLEVGAGTGAWAVWAGLQGAADVLGIEPQSEGSTDDTLNQFRMAIERLGLSDRVRAAAKTLQELEPTDPPFDVAVMYNVINHLDEEAVVDLHRNSAAQDRYVGYLRHLRALLRDHAWLIVADCSRQNCWNQLGLASPLAPSIEWHKHQGPETWVSVLERADFDRFDLRWSPVQPFTRVTANRLVQYFTASHFVLRARATPRLRVPQR